jgi:predicted DNA-binding protein with PD1-like motif
MVDLKKYQVPKIVGANQGVPYWIRLSLLLLLLAGVAWMAYKQGGSSLAQGFARLQSGMDHVQSLEQERNDLRRELAMVKQAGEVDREALLAVREQIKKLQDERLKMEEELTFLRGIVSTSSKKQVLRVQNFKLEPGFEAQQFIYKFTVSQVINSGSVVKGRIEVAIMGLQGGHSKLLKLEQMSDEKLSSHKMRFRYYQNVEGKIQLPADFQPASITINVKPSSTKLKSVSESYSWSPIS